MGFEIANKIGIGLIVFVVLAALVMIAPFLILGGSQLFQKLTWGKEEEARLAERYLAEQYGESFSVIPGSVFYYSSFEETTMRAYPDSDPSITFITNVDHEKIRIYSDNYLLNFSMSKLFREAGLDKEFYYEADIERNFHAPLPEIAAEEWSADPSEQLQYWSGEELQINLFTYWKTEEPGGEFNQSLIGKIGTLIERMHEYELRGKVTLFFSKAAGNNAQHEAYLQMLDQRNNTELRDESLYQLESTAPYKSCRLPLDNVKIAEEIPDYLKINCSSLYDLAL
ncbi:hypothetical protein [Paenibacillus tengchongensis]|uniref:hypothetical protein n=1 Tax=Paenibacillus tengchongensis TaxID=2608684 RepID=UPI00124E3D6C|nr:hypothetical protein [Paenibacillus tengchongensis]